MKYCSRCGKQAIDGGLTCAYCGQSLVNPVEQREDDSSSIGLAVFSFFFQLIGFVMYYVYKSSSPLKAKSALMGSVIGSVVSFVIWFVLEATGINIFQYFM